MLLLSMHAMAAATPPLVDLGSLYILATMIVEGFRSMLKAQSVIIISLFRKLLDQQDRTGRS